MISKQGNKDILIYIVSDGTGDTASRVVNIALTQFKIKPPIETWSDVLTIESVKNIVYKASQNSALIFYTLVKEEIRDAMKNETRHKKIVSVDLLGSSLRTLRTALGCEPSETPGLSRELEKDRIMKMHAIDFALEHDDGKNPKGIKNADIVLVGVSRASKSSTAFYLGYCGIKTANIPIHYQNALPRDLLDEAVKNKIIALTIQPEHLRSVRQIRADYFQFRIDDPYIDKVEIAKEIKHLNKLIEKYQWKSIAVVNKAIEEIASEAARLVLKIPIIPGA